MERRVSSALGIDDVLDGAAGVELTLSVLARGSRAAGGGAGDGVGRAEAVPRTPSPPLVFWSMPRFFCEVDMTEWSGSYSSSCSSPR